jgi:hypothetical protein
MFLIALIIEFKNLAPKAFLLPHMGTEKERVLANSYGLNL